MRKLSLLLGLVVLSGCGGSSPSSSSGGGTLALIRQVLASGLNQPMQYKVSPANSTLAYVLERGGTVRVMVNDVLQATPVMDISSEVTTNGEGGLLGIAFDPNFASNHQFYLHYSKGANVDTQVSRFTMDSSGLTANPGTEHSVISISQAPYTNHKGGSINFGPDGYLYMGLGDGGSANDPSNHAQDPTSLLGKMLRIDPTGDDFPADSVNNYSIPSTNPFASTAGVRGEIWAFGVRNPFRWGFDSASHGMVIADVGQDAVEEVDFQPAGVGGRNYGWRLREGNIATSNGGTAFSTFTDPFFVINHPISEAIIGGYVYHGSAFPVLAGRYIIGDEVNSLLWAVPLSFSGGEANSVSFSSVTTISPGGGIASPVSIEPDKNGEPVVCELGAGTVTRLAPGP